ncbi:DUF3892 domain-containing protein [Enterococcus sp. AZ192]|uniref:DUF3892 domain-containing protein n=1 Tax=unclassified Enterococcus TaxID=2608891 RepID=UPI003D294953
MIQATKIQMYDGMSNSNSVTEIKSIYLIGVKEEGFFSKESIYDFLKKNPNSHIEVAISPYPKLIPATNGIQKYVRSEPNDTPNDNLLKLPRI